MAVTKYKYGNMFASGSDHECRGQDKQRWRNKVTALQIGAHRSEAETVVRGWQRPCMNYTSNGSR